MILATEGTWPFLSRDNPLLRCGGLGSSANSALRLPMDAAQEEAGVNSSGAVRDVSDSMLRC
jgi:hypothetical protein